MISLATSYPSIKALIAAYRDAGGAVADVKHAPVITVSTTVDCAGTPPTFYVNWTYPLADQPANLYKGVLDMRTVLALQAPGVQSWNTRSVNFIEKEFPDYEFVGAHAAKWYAHYKRMPEFLELCPSGYLAFIEKYLDSRNELAVVYLYAHCGKVYIGHDYTFASSRFDAGVHFAVRRKPSA